MDEKTNFPSPDLSSFDPIKTDSMKNDPGSIMAGKPESVSSFGSDIKPPDTSSMPKVGIESAFDQKNQDNLGGGLPEKKKSSVLIWVIGMILLAVISAAGSGYAVYYMQNSNTQPLVKDKALLQSQVANLKNQVEVLTKEKTNLELEVERLEEELNAKSTPAVEGSAPQTQTGANAQGQSVPTVPVNSDNPVAPGQ